MLRLPEEMSHAGGRLGHAPANTRSALPAASAGTCLALAAA
jgi:hypothetical protein